MGAVIMRGASMARPRWASASEGATPSSRGVTARTKEKHDDRTALSCSEAGDGAFSAGPSQAVQERLTQPPRQTAQCNARRPRQSDGAGGEEPRLLLEPNGRGVPRAARGSRSLGRDSPTWYLPYQAGEKSTTRASSL